jgi:hypothetical protein
MSSTFAAEYTAALATETVARKRLDTALRHVTPLSAELHEQALKHPETYARCLRQVADIMDTIPGLRAALADAVATVEPLHSRCCHNCHGTGLYQAPTTHLTRGRPVCWTCNGSGENAASRKARQHA